MRLHLEREEILDRVRRALRLYPEDRGRPMRLRVESEEGEEVLNLSEDIDPTNVVQAVLAAYQRYPRDYVMVLVGEQIIELWAE